LSHLNHDSPKLLTPKEEIEETAKELDQSIGGGGGSASDTSKSSDTP
jgi:hypothetical protein